MVRDRRQRVAGLDLVRADEGAPVRHGRVDRDGLEQGAIGEERSLDLRIGGMLRSDRVRLRIHPPVGAARQEIALTGHVESAERAVVGRIGRPVARLDVRVFHGADVLAVARTRDREPWRGSVADRSTGVATGARWGDAQDGGAEQDPGGCHGDDPLMAEPVDDETRRPRAL